MGNESYGRYMLFQSELNEKHFYLLGHLNRVAQGMEKDISVKPGTVVAYVGNTGNSGGPHLHLHFMI